MGIGAISSSIYTPPSAQQSAAVRDPAAKKAELSKEELAQVDKLKARDTEVRAHEQAHLAAAGGLATSGATYTYQRGPDGVSYAIGGEVNIDTSAGRTPEETLDRARTIQAAALAPADPSAQDRAVAARARQLETEARSEIALKQQEVGKAYGVSGKQADGQARVDTYA